MHWTRRLDRHAGKDARPDLRTITWISALSVLAVKRRLVLLTLLNRAHSAGLSLEVYGLFLSCLVFYNCQAPFQLFILKMRLLSRTITYRNRFYLYLFEGLNQFLCSDRAVPLFHTDALDHTWGHPWPPTTQLLALTDGLIKHID